jgi:predicted nucleotidyltransferase
MAKNKVIEAIKFLKQCLTESDLKISRIVLFGSQPKGTSTKESDIDIVIVSEDFEGKNIFERASLTKNAEIRTIKKYMIPLDIITLSPKEWKNEKSLIVHYAKEGRVVYGR